MANQEIRKLLADLVRQNSVSAPLPTQAENYMWGRSMLNPVVKPYSTGPVATEDIRGPSPVNRILDLLSRPLYAVANPIKQVAELAQQNVEEGATPGQAAQSFLDFYTSGQHSEASLRGISGKDKTTGKDVLETLGYKPEGVAGFAAGFGTDIALDPLTYVGVGLAGRLGKAAEESVSALRAVEEGTGKAAQDIAEEISNRAAGLSVPSPRTPDRTPPKPSIPLRGQEQAPPRIFMAEGRNAPAQLPAIRQPQGVPTASVAGAGDTIATPIPKPQIASHLLKEISGDSPNWKKLQQRQLNKLPSDADIATVRQAIEQQFKLEKNPVFKNMLRQQIRKLDQGVQPAHLVDKAIATTMPDFPPIKLSQTRLANALAVASNFMKRNTFDEINHIGQTRLYDAIFASVKKMRIPAKAQKSVILHSLRAAEDALLSQGRKLVDAEGYSVRLSDYLNASGGSKALSPKLIDDFRSGKPLQIVEDLKAKQAAITAGEVLDPVLKTAQSIRQRAVAEGLPPSRTVQLGDDMSSALSGLAKEAGASAKEAGAAKNFIKDLFDVNRDQLYDDVMQEARGLLRQSMEGKTDPHLLDRINKKVYQALRGNPKVFGNSILQTRVVEAIMMRVATWWNAKDIRPFAREYIDTARNIAAAFHQSLTPLIRATTRTQRRTGWAIARGKVTSGSVDDQQVADQLRYMMERLLGAEDVSDAAKAESVLVRSGITMQQLNKELPPQLKFTDKKITDVIGREADYTKGKWMHSWREWDVAEPTEAMYQLVRAMQMVTKKNAFLDDAAARWGVPVRGGEFQHTVDAERLKGFYFPKQIADQLNITWRRIESDKMKFGGEFMQHVDKIQRMWKSGVTIYSPSHHIRNLNGDIYLSALDGVKTVVPYKKALQVMHAHRSRYTDIEEVTNIMDADLRELAMKARPGNILVTTKAGHRLTSEQLYQAAESQGILLRAGVLEDLIGGEELISGTFGTRFAPFKGRVHDIATKTSETRDHFVRIAHFIDVLSKSKVKNLRDAIEIAGRRVKKFHPDGSDLTGFERTFMRRLIPFYSWLRKATPLVIEGIAMRPHVSLVFPRAMTNLQTITGIESQGPGDPFPMDQMFPEWIKEKGVGPVIPPGHDLAGIGRQQNWKGDAPGYVVINPTNPMLDQVKELTDPKQAILSGLTPFLRVPGELVSGHTSLGIPLEAVEGGTAGHIAQQVPLVGIGARVTGRTRPDEPYQPEQLINWLTSAGITGTGPFREQAGFEIREKLQQIANKNREAMR